MRQRPLVLLGVFAALGIAYALFFTDWLRPEPIQIVSQVRASILQPTFKAPTRKVAKTNAETGQVEIHVQKAKTNVMDAAAQARRVRLPDWGPIDHAPGGVANVTFSLDAAYSLTSVRVQDVPADGSTPKVLWEAKGQSSPTRSLFYGKVPNGMKLVGTRTNAEPLVAGAPYVLIVEAGRRRGTNSFRTAPAPAE